MPKNITVATKLYGLYRNNTLVNISDDEEILQNLMQSDEDIIEEFTDPDSDFTTRDAKDCEMFDIIHNDSDHEYGYTEIDFVDGEYKALMYQVRFPLKNSYRDAVEYLSDNNAKSYADEAKTVTGIVAKHCDFWLEDFDENTPLTVFCIPDEYKTMLLQTGFKSGMVLLAD